MVAVVCCGYLCGVTIHDVCDVSLRQCLPKQLAASIFRATIIEHRCEYLN